MIEWRNLIYRHLAVYKTMAFKDCTMNMSYSRHAVVLYYIVVISIVSMFHCRFLNVKFIVAILQLCNSITWQSRRILSYDWSIIQNCNITTCAVPPSFELHCTLINNDGRRQDRQATTKYEYTPTRMIWLPWQQINCSELWNSQV